MAKKAYIGVNGVARDVKAIYTGVNGVAREITKGYIGVNGVARQSYDKWNYDYPPVVMNKGYSKLDIEDCRHFTLVQDVGAVYEYDVHEETSSVTFSLPSELPEGDYIVTAIIDNVKYEETKSIKTSISWFGCGFSYERDEWLWRLGENGSTQITGKSNEHPVSGVTTISYLAIEPA